MTVPAENRASVQRVDITGNERRLGARVTSLGRTAECFCRGARRSLPFLVRRRARLVAGPVGTATATPEPPVPGPVCVVTLEARGRSGFVALRLSPGALQLIVDGSLGGAPPEEGDTTESPAASLTAAQRALVIRVARALGADLADAARAELGVELSVAKAECLRDAEYSSLPRDAVVAECVFDGVHGEASIWLVASGEAIDATPRERAAGGPASPDPRLPGAIQGVPVEVVVELGRVKLGLRRVLALRPGEVLRLSTATDDPVRVLVAGIPKLTGVPAISRGQLSVQITGRHG